VNNFDINNCTVPEAINYSLTKIIEQGVRCVSDTNKCAYKNSKGQHCAIGWLLDHDNELLMNYSGSISALSEDYPEFLPAIINRSTLHAFSLLQLLHDSILKCPTLNIYKISAKLESKGVNPELINEWLILNKVPKQ